MLLYSIEKLSLEMEFTLLTLDPSMFVQQFPAKPLLL